MQMDGHSRTLSAEAARVVSDGCKHAKVSAAWPPLSCCTCGVSKSRAMTETEATWAARLEDWHTSGPTASAVCKDKDFSHGGLRYWTSLLRRTDAATSIKAVRLARVVRPPPR